MKQDFIQLNMFDLIFPKTESNKWQPPSEEELFAELQYKKVYHYGDTEHNNYVWTYGDPEERQLAIQINNRIISLDTRFKESETFDYQFRFPACGMSYFNDKGQFSHFMDREKILNEICGFNNGRLCEWAKGLKVEFCTSELSLREIINNIRSYFEVNKTIVFNSD